MICCSILFCTVNYGYILPFSGGVEDIMYKFSDEVVNSTVNLIFNYFYNNDKNVVICFDDEAEETVNERANALEEKVKEYLPNSFRKRVTFSKCVVLNDEKEAEKIKKQNVVTVAHKSSKYLPPAYLPIDNPRKVKSNYSELINYIFSLSVPERKKLFGTLEEKVEKGIEKAGKQVSSRDYRVWYDNYGALMGLNIKELVEKIKNVSNKSKYNKYGDDLQSDIRSKEQEYIDYVADVKVKNEEEINNRIQEYIQLWDEAIGKEHYDFNDMHRKAAIKMINEYYEDGNKREFDLEKINTVVPKIKLGDAGLIDVFDKWYYRTKDKKYSCIRDFKSDFGIINVSPENSQRFNTLKEQKVKELVEVLLSLKDEELFIGQAEIFINEMESEINEDERTEIEEAVWESFDSYVNNRFIELGYNDHVDNEDELQRALKIIENFKNEYLGKAFSGILEDVLKIEE